MDASNIHLLSMDAAGRKEADDSRHAFSDSVDITVHIPDYDNFKTDDQLYSESYSAGGFRWRLLVFPQGNRISDVLSAYLDFVGCDEEPDQRPRDALTRSCRSRVCNSRAQSGKSGEVTLPCEAPVVNPEEPGSVDNENSTDSDAHVSAVPHTDTSSIVTDAAGVAGDFEQPTPLGEDVPPGHAAVGTPVLAGTGDSVDSAAACDPECDNEWETVAHTVPAPPSQTSTSVQGADATSPRSDASLSSGDEISDDEDDIAPPRADTAQETSARIVEAQVWFYVVAPWSMGSTEREDDDESTATLPSDECTALPTTGSRFEMESPLQTDPSAVLLKNCRHRFSSPGNDWGFRELVPSSRTKKFVDATGTVTLKAHVVVYSRLYTAVRDQIMLQSPPEGVNWKSVIELVQKYGALAAEAPTSSGLAHLNDSASLLHAACKEGNKDYAGLLLARGATLHVEDDSGRTALFYAARAGYLDIVKWLVEGKNMTVNALDSENRTALFYACEEGRIEIVQYLLGQGAEFTIADFDGDTPARLAEGRGHDEIAALLRSLQM